ncbi:hypothetical protein SORDD16_01855 [Streptococcus oralis]|uniref:Uncharacterized protein n=1 Tax=Streptococcus oralis TaxID=1303 RepID=A0A139P524_STROR|nr:hypothetical protein SORDD16_01855 [Streptococcus oralis]
MQRRWRFDLQILMLKLIGLLRSNLSFGCSMQRHWRFD